MPLETTNVSDFFGSADQLLEKFQSRQQAQAAPAQSAPTQTLVPQTQNLPEQQIAQKVDLKTISPVEGSISTGVSADDLIKKFEEAAKPAETAVTAEEVKPEEEKAEGEEIKPEKEVKKGRPEKEKIPDQFSALVPILEEKGFIKGFADGKYESIEDVVELFEANREEEKVTLRKEVEQQYYDSKSPAWKLVAKYSESLRNPAELAPFLTALDNVQYSAELDVNSAEDQELIISNALAIKGLSAEDIETDIKDFKERGILAERAKNLKPVLDKYNQQQVANMLQEQEQAQRANEAYWQQHQKQVYEKVMNSPTIGGMKLKKQDREIAFAALGQPDPQLGGLGIYAIIDNLMEKKDFETLTEVLLVAINKKGYRDYITNTVKATEAENTQRALRTSEKSTPIAVEQTPAGKIERPTTAKWFSSIRK